MRPNWFVKPLLVLLSNVDLLELQCSGNCEEVWEELSSEVVQKKMGRVPGCDYQVFFLLGRGPNHVF